MLSRADAALMLEAHPDLFDHPAQPALVDTFLGDDRHHMAGVLLDGALVGFASGVTYVHPDKAETMWINEVGVLEAHRRRGIGRAAVRTVLDHARSIGCAQVWLATEADNTPALALYNSLDGREEREIVTFEWGTDPSR